MADLKEETTVDNTEITEVETIEEKRKPVDPNLEGIQLFYEKNKNAVNYIGGGALLIIAAFCFFKFYYLPGKESEALNEIYWAETFLEKDSFNVALKGGITVNAPEGPKQMMGFEAIADEYSMTKAGSLASYCAGICYLRTGKYEEAIPFLSKYDGQDAIVAPIALGAIGDCHLEMNRIDEAVKFYLKASEESKNEFTTPHYLKKAGFAYEMQKNYEMALKIYDRIKKEFPKSTEGRGIDKVIAKVKALGNF